MQDAKGTLVYPGDEVEVQGLRYIVLGKETFGPAIQIQCKLTGATFLAEPYEIEAIYSGAGDVNRT